MSLGQQASKERGRDRDGEKEKERRMEIEREREREEKEERKNGKDASELFFQFSNAFPKSIKMYWALRQQTKSSSKLYVEKAGIIPQVSAMIYNDMNESWIWQSSIYLMKNLLKKKKKDWKKADRRLARTSMSMITALVYLSLTTIWLVINIFFPVFLIALFPFWIYKAMIICQFLVDVRAHQNLGHGLETF